MSKKIKAILDYWSPKDKTVVTESGFTYLDTKSEIKETKTIEDITEIGMFEQFYKLNNSLRYCNGSHYTWQSPKWKQKYDAWLKSEDFKKKSFNLFYGNGVVD